MALLTFHYYCISLLRRNTEAVLQLQRDCFFFPLFVEKYHKSKNVFSGFSLQIYLRTNSWKEKRLNIKNNFINEKKTISGVTKLPPSGMQGLNTVERRTI